MKWTSKNIFISLVCRWRRIQSWTQRVFDSWACWGWIFWCWSTSHSYEDRNHYHGNPNTKCIGRERAPNSWTDGKFMQIYNRNCHRVKQFFESEDTSLPNGRFFSHLGSSSEAIWLSRKFSWIICWKGCYPWLMCYRSSWIPEIQIDRRISCSKVSIDLSDKWVNKIAYR